MPLVSVIMSVYNGERYLAEAIDSILSQTLADFELLVVDDGSQDNSAEIVRDYQTRDSRVRFFQLEHNVGIASARNHGLTEASGEYVTMMDCDDISLPERLGMQVAFLSANPDIDVVGVSGKAADEGLIPLFDLIMPQQHCLIAFGMFVGVGLIFSTVMLRRELLVKIGGYEPGRRTSEERELAWRLLYASKLQFANLQDTLFLYRRHAGSMGQDDDTELEKEREEVRARMLQQLWGKAPPETLDRFLRLRINKKLGWLERRAAKREMRQLIASLIAQKLVDCNDRQTLVSAMNQRLEGTTPRIWQRFLHWQRKHFLRQL